MKVIKLESLLSHGFGANRSSLTYGFGCVIACLTSQGHGSGSILYVLTDDGNEEMRLTWEDSREYLNYDNPVIIEHGTYYLGLLIAANFTDFNNLEASLSPSGLDYWLFKRDPYAESGQTFFDKEMVKLQISGILRAGHDNDTLSRFDTELNQVLKSGFPTSKTYISIIEFGRPSAVFRSIIPQKTNPFAIPLVKLDEVNAELISHLAKHPHHLYDVHPRKYEVLVAELLRDMGYDVFLTPPTVDGGRDILALFETPARGKILTLIECKRYRQDRPVGIDVIKQFLWTLRDQDKANIGLIVTTSHFSESARMIEKNNSWLLNLHDFGKMKEWLNNYGQWNKSNLDGGLWLPTSPIISSK